jgi:hypothetical protein
MKRSTAGVANTRLAQFAYKTYIEEVYMQTRLRVNDVLYVMKKGNSFWN